MITSQTINIMALNDDRRRIHEHIGRFTVQAAAIDQRLAELLNALDPSQVAQPGKYLSWRRKIELISVQPRVASWAQWPALEKSLAEIADYRNQLDHSVLVSRISMETGLVVHSGIRESQGFIPEPFDLAQLAQAEDQANVVFLGLYALVRGHIGDFESFTMRTLAVGMLTDDSLLNTLNHVYPEASDV